MSRPLSIPVILGTTRKGRMSAHAARFIAGQLAKQEGVVSEMIDIAAVSAEEAARVDPALGGLIEEAYGCPECGKTASRRAAPGWL